MWNHVFKHALHHQTKNTGFHFSYTFNAKSIFYVAFLMCLYISVFIIIISLYVHKHTCDIFMLQKKIAKEEKLDTLTSRRIERAGRRLLLGNWITSIEYQTKLFFYGIPSFRFIQRIFICLVEHSFRKQFRVKQKNKTKYRNKNEILNTLYPSLPPYLLGVFLYSFYYSLQNVEATHRRRKKLK